MGIVAEVTYVGEDDGSMTFSRYVVREWESGTSGCFAFLAVAHTLSGTSEPESIAGADLSLVWTLRRV